MNNSKWQRLMAALLVAAMLTASFAPVAMAAPQAAVAAQAQGSEVSGTIPGGQFAKIWLGLEPINPGTVTVRAEWDRENALTSGLGFYILDEQNLNAVSNGEPVRDNNIGAGDPNFYLNSPTSVQGAAFRAVGPEYTVVVFNDSAADANFKLAVDNGTLSDDSGQVTVAGAVTPEAAAATGEAEAAAPAATTAAPAEAVTTTVAAATPAATAEATPAAVVAVASGPVQAQQMQGELPNQFDQHFLSLEPEIRDGNMTVVMSYDPQDSTELARRINFWVLDQNGWNSYQDGESASSVAIAAGSKSFTDPDTSNKREASFKASNFGPYTVIVQNNSRVPATYDLSVKGGIFTDDSNQTLTAKAANSGTITGTTTAAAADVAATGTTTTTTTTTATTTPTTTGVVGEPGGTYTVKSGDTLAIIARDIYGDYRLYEQLCAFNSIADCNSIEVGQVVKLPTQAEIGSTATAAPAATTAAAVATPAATTAAVATPAATTAAAATPAASTATTSTTTTAVTTTAPVTSTSATTSSVAATTTTTKTTSATTTTASGSIVDVAESAGSFSILLNALKQTGIDSELATGGPYTVFAPTDAAFNALLSGNGLTEAQLLQAKELSDILRYHVLSGKVLAADMATGTKATTLQGKPVNFEVKNGKVYINGAEIVTTDIPAANGVIQAIDAVILPPQ